MDLSIFQWLNNWAGRAEWLDAIIIFSAGYLGWWLLFALLLFLIFGKNKIQIVLTSLFAAVISRFVFTEIIRFFYSKARPFEVLDAYQLLFHEAGGALPSGHAAFFFALAAGVYFYHKKIGVLFLSAALLIGIARVAAGIHWPSDILAGAIIGIATAYGFRKAVLRYLKNRSTS